MGYNQDLEPDFSGDLSSHHLFISVVILSFLTFLLLCYLIIRSIFSRERGMREFAISRIAGNAAHDHVITIPATALGLDDAAINGIPAFVVGEFQEDVDRGECSICLGRYEEEEVVKVLPDCRHSFHSDCVDAWLRSRATCPLCRMPLDSCSKVAMAESS